MAHICGFYYLIPDNIYGAHMRYYLPLVELHAHTTILSIASRTQLTQTFVNPSSDKAIKQVRYTFPLYDGVSVVGFTCRIGDRVIQGEVKERGKAIQVFNEAVERGETAGLLEQLPEASDVFTTTVGNVPPGAKIIVEITYVGELKHDAEVDGIRFTIPTSIAPRYGHNPVTLTGDQATAAQGGNITITVDATLGNDSVIRQVRSPSHPIAVSMGITSCSDDNPSMSRVSATLSLGTAELGTDFVLQIVTKDPPTPRALLEEHPFIPGQRALMATLVPKFALPSARPEIVFVCDRSGSMSGGKIQALVSALRVFLKSLPVGVKFNICSFGATHSFLWKRSEPYSQSTLDKAVRHVQAFDANLGGTELLAPIKSTIERRYKDMSLEVILVTDGEIWDQQALFDYLNKEISETKAPIRVFTLGIGNDVSHALVEGIARAGNGFSQLVGLNEKFDSKVVRMLKGALSPNINDYTLEVRYAHEDAMDDDDFEMVEKVTDSLKVKLDLSDDDSSGKATRSEKMSISLFDMSANPDKDSTPPADDANDQARYAHLPAVPEPKLLQAPTRIPQLFPFIRTSVFLLMSPSTIQRIPTSVLLRGNSSHGPLELEIPVEAVQGKSSIIHQLAAKKAIAELEEGRGWLQNAMEESGGAKLKDKYDGRFDEMVEREAVRLGVRFQVGGRWCSFLAVEEQDASTSGSMQDAEKEWEYVDLMPPGTTSKRKGVQLEDVQEQSIPSSSLFRANAFQSQDPPPSRSAMLSSMPHSAQYASPTSSRFACAPSTASYDSNTASMLRSQQIRLHAAHQQQQNGFHSANQQQRGGIRSAHFSSRGGFVGRGGIGAPVAGSAHATNQNYQQAQSAPAMLSNAAAMPTRGQGVVENALSIEAEEEAGEDECLELRLFDRTHDSDPHGGSNTSQSPQQMSTQQMHMRMPQHQQQQRQSMMLASAALPMEVQQQKRRKSKSSSFGSTRRKLEIHQAQPQAQLSSDPLHALIALQSFEGNWGLTPELLTIVGLRKVDPVLIRQHGEKVVGTILAIVWLENKMMEEHESWELVAVKARTWLEGMGLNDADQVWEAMGQLVV